MRALLAAIVPVAGLADVPPFRLKSTFVLAVAWVPQLSYLPGTYTAFNFPAASYAEKVNVCPSQR